MRGSHPTFNSFKLGIGAVVAAPTGNPLICGKGFGTTIANAKGFTCLHHRQGRPAAGGAMAVVTGGLRLGTERIMVACYPGCAEIMHTMGTAVDARGHGRMADRTLTNGGRISLGIDGRHVVVHLIAVGTGLIRELGMGRVVTGLALQFAVASAEAEQAPSF